MDAITLLKSQHEEVEALFAKYEKAKDGSSKILKQCTLPITGKGVVSLIITDLCVFAVKPGGGQGDSAARGLVLTELHPGVTLDDVKAKTAAPFEVKL